MNRNLIFCLILVILLLGCAGAQKSVNNNPSLDQQISSLVEQIIMGLSQSQVTKIAIIPFSDLQKNASNLGIYIAEELTTKLYQSGRFEVVERNLLQKILDEQKLSVSGFIDDETAVSLGKVLGVGAIATGTLTDLGTNLKVNARLINTTSGKVFSAASVTIYKDLTTAKLLGEDPIDLQTNATKAKSKSYKANWMQFSFELTATENEGGNLTCQLQIHNKSKQDENLRIISLGRASSGYVYSHLYDSSGNQYKDLFLRYGNEGFQQLNYYPGLIDKTILAEMTIPLEIQIHDIPENLSDIPLLQLIVGDYPGYKLKFKKVPVPFQ